MKKAMFLSAIYSLIATWPSFAADLPAKAIKRDTSVPVVATSPFYFGFWGGVGLSPTMNDFTIDGVEQGGAPIKGYPTGILVGLEAGYTLAPGPISFRLTFDAAYDFSRGCVDFACIAARKNGWLLQEGIGIPISLTTIGGYIPTAGQPSNWPVPVTVPTSVWSNMLITPRGGYAERNLDLCALNGLVDANGNDVTACGSKFIAAPYAGLELSFMASTNSEIALRWDHVFWGNQYSFTPAAAIPLFQNSVNITKEDLLTVHYNYHF